MLNVLEVEDDTAPGDRAISASVDVTFQGLVVYNDEGDTFVRDVVIRYRYRKVGVAAWTLEANRTYSGQTASALRFSENIRFPEAGEYEIEVTRISNLATVVFQVSEVAFLTAVRSVQAGKLPSHLDIAEVAVRIKATDQLNGQLDSLNGIALQMAREWTGTGWTAFKPVRHPAWVYTRALTGPMLANAVADTRVELDDMLAWAQEEPHWTCDAVIDQPVSGAEVLGLICATGRARRAMRDLKYSVVRDGGAGPIVQQFTPRNSYNLEASITFPKEIHGFRMRFISERLEWQQDELVVYADGYSAANATIFETVPLSGVVLTKNEANGGNPWRLGRYNLAQVKLRPEEFIWQADLDHLRVQLGDKVRFVHDVPLIGVGSGRVSDFTVDGGGFLASVELDELISVADDQYRMCVRLEDGSELLFAATPPVSFDGIWNVIAGQNVSASGIGLGDLVSVELMAQESMELLIKAIQHQGDMQARLTGVAAAPEVLQADTGTIPDYVPNIANVQPREQLLPARPALQSITPTVLLGPPRAVARVVLADYDRFDVERYFVTMVSPTGAETNHGPFLSGEFDLPLLMFGSHQISVQLENKAGETSLVLPLTAQWTLALTRPADVANFRADVVGNHITLTWDADDLLAKRYEVRHLPTGNDGGWSQATPVGRDIQGGVATVPLLGGRFLIHAYGHWDQQSQNPATVTVSDSNVYGLNVVKQLIEHPGFSGGKTPNITLSRDRLLLGSDLGMTSWPALSSVGNIAIFGGVAPSGEYNLSEVVDLGAVYVSRLSADIRASEYLRDFRLSNWPNLSAVQSMFGSVEDGIWGVTLLFQTTLDDPSDVAAVWSDWAEFRGGDHEARGYRFKLILESSDPNVQVVVWGLKVSIDMPDRVDGGDDIVCPPEGVYISFQPPFREKPAIAVTGQQLPSGFVEKRTLVSAQGFHTQFVDASDQGVTCTIDWIAKGYGRET